MRAAWRSLRNARAYTVTVIVTLAIGIGLSTAIFTVVDCVLLRPLGYRDADRIVGIETHFNSEGWTNPRMSGGDYNDLRRQVHGLDAVAWYNSYADGMEVKGNSVYGPIAHVTPEFARVMGVEPVAGHLFQAGEGRRTDALVSEGFARAHWGSAQAAVGGSVTYAGELYTVAGVLPALFNFPNKSEVWLEQEADIREGRSSYSGSIVGRRSAGTSEEELDAELRTWSARMQHSIAEDHDKQWLAVSLQEQLVGPVRPTLQLLFGGSGLLLLVVCANLAHLQLVRATRGLRALTIRTALGAGRGALLRSSLAETLLLAAAGGAGALLVAEPALLLLKRMAPPNLPRLEDVQLNGEVLAYSLLVSLAVMVAATLLPVWRSWRLDPAAALRSDAGRGTESRGAARLRQALLVAEIALTMTLAVAAVLLARQLGAEDHAQLGFQPAALVVLDTHEVVSTPAPALPKSNARSELARYWADWQPIFDRNVQRTTALLERVRREPGVQEAEAIDDAPMGPGGSDISYVVQGRGVFGPGETHMPNADVHVATEGIFRALGVPLLRGRAFQSYDRAGTERVAVVNEALARQSFRGEDPVGKEIVCGFDTDPTVDHSYWRIVGVVADIRAESPGESPRPTFYVPLAQHSTRAADMQVVARIEGSPAAMAARLKEVLSAERPDVAVQATTMQAATEEKQLPERFRGALFGSFALVSVVLAAVGMYGVTAYTVEQRRREFALRMALGADRGRVLGWVLGSAARASAAGLLLGALFAVFAGRALASVLGPLATGVEDGAAGYAIAGAGVLVLVLLAAWVPAQRASATEPMDALRAE